MRHKLLLIFLLAFLTKSSMVFSATFTSASGGSYTVPATWSVVGADADGIPDSGDDVFISTGHTITFIASGAARNLTINPGGILNIAGFTVLNYGSLTNNGTILGTGSWRFQSVGTYSGNPMPSQGSIYFYGNYTIAAGVTVTKSNGGIVVGAGCNVTNNGLIALNHGANGYIQFLSSTSRWINASGSTLAVSAGFIGTGILTASAVPNTINYKNIGASSIKNTTYCNLAFNGISAHTKTLQGNITVLNNLVIGANTTVNWAGFNITLGGNWTNNANTTCTNMGTLVFTGSGTQTITRATGNIETFNNFDLSGTGTVQLNDTIRVNGLLAINSGTLDVSASNYSIHCRGDFQDNSSFNARQGTLFMDGTIAQSIDGSVSTAFYNITVSNLAGVSVNFTKSIANILSVQSGAFGPSGFGSVILTATGPTTCARIGPLGATGSITGSSWSIQTYINGPATAYWQYLGSPVVSSTIGDWDGDARFYMSGVGGNDGNACCPVFRSVRTYNTATNTYSNVTSTTTALTPGRGFMVWMSDNMTGLVSPLIYDTRGTPNSNTVNRAVVSGGAGAGYNLVSNPYACPVNWASVVAASSATLNPSFIILQENGSYATDPNGGTIAGGQGFMCVATTSANMTFTESCKSIVANPNVIRQAAPGQVRIKVGNQVNGLGEETVVRLTADGDESYDAMIDLAYLPSPYDNATHIWTQNTNGEQFLLNNLGTSEDHLMVPVSVITSTPGMQTLTFKDLNTVTEYNCAWLEDLTTGARINLNSTDTYAFNENEMGATRNFILHFERTSDCSFDLQTSTTSLDAASNVFVNNGQIFAQFEFETEEAVTISMYDLGGRIVMGETTMNVTQQTVSLTNPDAHGIYLVRIQKGNEIATKKIYY